MILKINPKQSISQIMHSLSSGDTLLLEDGIYKEKIEIWKSYEKIKARMVVHKALDKGDRDMAKWYLERKAKDEFNTKMEIDAAVKDKVKVVIIDDLPDEE